MADFTLSGRRHPIFSHTGAGNRFRIDLSQIDEYAANALGYVQSGVNPVRPHPGAGVVELFEIPSASRASTFGPDLTEPTIVSVKVDSSTFTNPSTRSFEYEITEIVSVSPLVDGATDAASGFAALKARWRDGADFKAQVRRVASAGGDSISGSPQLEPEKLVVEGAPIGLWPGTADTANDRNVTIDSSFESTDPATGQFHNGFYVLRANPNSATALAKGGDASAGGVCEKLVAKCSYGGGQTVWMEIDVTSPAAGTLAATDGLKVSAGPPVTPALVMETVGETLGVSVRFFSVYVVDAGSDGGGYGVLKHLDFPLTTSGYGTFKRFDVATENVSAYLKNGVTVDSSAAGYLGLTSSVDVAGQSTVCATTSEQGVIRLRLTRTAAGAGGSVDLVTHFSTPKFLDRFLVRSAVTNLVSPPALLEYTVTNADNVEFIDLSTAAAVTTFTQANVDARLIVGRVLDSSGISDTADHFSFDVEVEDVRLSLSSPAPQTITRAIPGSYRNISAETSGYVAENAWLRGGNDVTWALLGGVKGAAPKEILIQNSDTRKVLENLTTGGTTLFSANDNALKLKSNLNSTVGKINFEVGEVSGVVQIAEPVDQTVYRAQVDLNGDPAIPNKLYADTRLGGRELDAATAPADQDVMEWNQATLKWVPRCLKSCDLSGIDVSAERTTLSYLASDAIVNKHLYGKKIKLLAFEPIATGRLVSVFSSGTNVRARLPRPAAQAVNSHTSGIGVTLTNAASAGDPIEVAVSGICSIALGGYENEIPVTTSRFIQDAGVVAWMGCKYNDATDTGYAACYTDSTATRFGNNTRIGVVWDNSRTVDLTTGVCQSVLVYINSSYEN